MAGLPLKLGLVGALLAFEGMREAYVIEANEEPVGPQFSLFATDDYLLATGQWVRSDGGSSLISKASQIECFRSWNKCIESHAQYYDDGKVIALQSDTHDIEQFTPQVVTYANANPQCAIYRVTIDLRQERVTALRTVTGNDAELCANLEPKIQMELRDGLSERLRVNPGTGHFLPMIQLLQAVLSG